MKKIIVATLILSSFLWAGKSLEKYIPIEELKDLTTKELKLKKIKEEMGIMETVSVRTDITTSSLKSTVQSQNEKLSTRDLELKKIKKEMGIKTPSKRDQRLDKIRYDLNIDYEVPQREGVYDSVKDTLDVGDSFDNALDSVKDTFSMVGSQKKTKKKKNDDFSFNQTLDDFYDTVGIKEGESWGLPSVLGFNKKKKARTFWGSKTLGATFLGDVKDSGSMFYSGMKNSGQSTEMMSGMMYHNSRMYNKMFGIFDDSPFNLFEEEKETSLFDFVEGGNGIMEMFN